MTRKMAFSPYACCFLLAFLALESAATRSIASGKLGMASSPSAIFIFGDSTSDPGNNNYVSTAFRANFPPYGKDFVNRTATGRFTNGRLANDFISKHFGIKEFVPPYLDPSLSIDELMTGVSFASAGSGFDPLTPTIGNVISLSAQLENFKQYIAKLEGAIGKERTQKLVNNALILVSAGTNDIVINYFGLPIRRKSYDIPSYLKFILQQVHQFLEGLVQLGGRRIGVVGLPPIGCLPVVITLYSDSPLIKRDCVDSFSAIGRDYNQMLQNELKSMQQSYAGSRFAYLDIYGVLEDITLRRKYDFEVVKSGCCGTGLLETSLICNPKSPICPDANTYVFFDSIHPSEKSYHLVFEAIRPAIEGLVRN